MTSSRDTTDEKSFWGPNLGQNWAWNWVFCHFLRFGSLFFLEIADSYSLQQCIASSRGKTHEKFLGTKFSQQRVKIRPKIRFFAEQCLATSWGKTHKKKLGFLSFFQVFFISFPINCIESNLGTLPNYY